MNLPIGVLIGVGVGILLLIGVIVYGGLWFNSNYVLMPVPRDQKENVEVCIDNDVSCSMIYESKDEIPE